MKIITPGYYLSFPPSSGSPRAAPQNTDKTKRWDSFLDRSLASGPGAGAVKKKGPKPDKNALQREVYGSEVYSSEVYSSEVYSSEVYRSEVYSSEVYRSEVYSSEVYSRAMRKIIHLAGTSPRPPQCHTGRLVVSYHGPRCLIEWLAKRSEQSIARGDQLSGQQSSQHGGHRNGKGQQSGQRSCQHRGQQRREKLRLLIQALDKEVGEMERQPIKASPSPNSATCCLVYVGSRSALLGSTRLQQSGVVEDLPKFFRPDSQWEVQSRWWTAAKSGHHRLGGRGAPAAGATQVCPASNV
ncbi:hypothetical protein FOCC_FOCC006512 [Frankliniella occidentalis]|nr:hypothetical protein FOCC_FOCC006512 [Frankliniella occidentalis]